MAHECEGCGYEFRTNLPGVSTREEPYFVHHVDGTTRYACSSVCMTRYLETVEFTEPRAPGEVVY